MKQFASIAQFIDMAEKDLVERCTLCGKCLESCPIFLHPKFSLTQKGPAAVMEKIVDLLKGRPDSTEAYLMINACTKGCHDNCRGACPQGIQILPAFIAGARRLKALGRGQTPGGYQYMPSHRCTFGHVLGDLQIKQSEVPWLKEIPAEPEPVDVVLFNSCGSLGSPNLVLEAIDILSRMGINFATLGGGSNDLCCGWVPLMQGAVEEGARLAQKYVNTLAKFRARKVISVCPGCAIVAGMFLPQCFEVPFEAEAVSIFLAKNINKLEFTRPLNKVVTVHDSCVLRTHGEWDVIRKLLQAIPGVTLVEMQHNRENVICCGGATNTNYPQALLERRLAMAEEAKAAGANVVATFCQWCQFHFCALEEWYPFEVKNVISLVAEAMGIHHEDKLKKIILTKDVNKVLAEAQEYIEASDLSLVEFEHALPTYFRDIF